MVLIWAALLGANSPFPTLWRHILKTRKLAVAAIAGLAALTLAACSGDETPEDTTTPEPVVEESVVEETPDAPEEPEEPAEPEEPEEPEEPAEPEAPAGDGSEAAPGESFAFGETARVNWDTHKSEDGVLLDVTVDGVREGSLDDLLALDLRDETAAAIEGHDVYYVDFSIVKADLSQVEILHTDGTSPIDAYNAGGSKLSNFAIIGGQFDTCESSAFKAEIDEGEVFEGCKIFLAPSGQEFGYAAWAQFDTVYADYGGEPLTWQ